MEYDYDEKVMLFKSLTGCDNDDQAWNFLANFDWNVNEAAEIFTLSAETGSQNQTPVKKNNSSKKVSTQVNSTKKDSKNYQEEKSQNEMNTYFTGILGLLNHRNIESFKKAIGSKIGIVIIFNDGDIDMLSDIFFNLKENEHIMDILNANYCVYLMNIATKEAKSFMDGFKISGITPLTLFVHDPDFHYLKNKKFVLDKIEGFLELSYLCEKITDNSSKICKKPHKIVDNKSISTNYTNYSDEANLSHSALLEKQKNELMEIERQAAEIEFQKIKEQEDLKRKTEEERLQNSVLKKKLSTDRKNRDSLKRNLLPEPSDNDPSKTFIAFRLPNGETIQRKFHKNYQVIELYNFIGTIENMLEDDNSSFDLITQFPMKIYNQYDITLEEAGLFPNSVIQVREL